MNQSTPGMMNESGYLLQQQIEAFLYREAAILDAWQLDEWLELFTEDAMYIVPATDHLNGNPTDSLCLIGDDMVTLKGRITRLKSRRAHREFPYSRTRRLVTNVRVLSDSTDEVRVEACFLVYRIRNGHADPMMGRYEYVLARTNEGFKIRLRRAELELEALRPHGTISIIL
jgi:p-cumate 2,3-dioxygenase beta subunit